MMIADSDVLIDFLRGKGPAADRMQIEVGTGRLHTTTVTAFQLLSGARTSKDGEKVATLLAALDVLPLDFEAAKHAARIRGDLEEQGQGIGTADYLIAGICLAHGGVLLTGNLKHFKRVPGLKLGGQFL